MFLLESFYLQEASYNALYSLSVETGAGPQALAEKENALREHREFAFLFTEKGSGPCLCGVLSQIITRIECNLKAVYSHHKILKSYGNRPEWILLLT